MKQECIIAKENFFGKGEHLYTHQLGWSQEDRRASRSSVSKKIFNYYVLECGTNLIIYNVADDHFYGIHSERFPVPIFRFAEDMNEEVAMDRTSNNTHDYDEGEILAEYDNPEDIWDNFKLNGESLEEILQHSYIGLN